jgi:hypothetical protein
LHEAQIQLMRQTGQIEAWVRQSLQAPAASAAPH